MTESNEFQDDVVDQGDMQAEAQSQAQGGSSGQVDPAEGADFGGDLDDENPAAGAESGDGDLLTEGGQSQVDPAEGTDFQQ